MKKMFTVVYHQYGEEKKESFFTAKNAAQWTLDQENKGAISYDVILDGDENVIADNYQPGLVGYEPLYELGAKR